MNTGTHMIPDRGNDAAGTGDRPAKKRFFTLKKALILIVALIILIPAAILVKNGIGADLTFRKVEKLTEKGEYDEARKKACVFLDRETTFEQYHLLINYIDLVKAYSEGDAATVRRILSADNPFPDPAFSNDARKKIEGIKRWLPAAYEKYLEAKKEKTEREYAEYRAGIPRVFMPEELIDQTTWGRHDYSVDKDTTFTNTLGNEVTYHVTKYYFKVSAFTCNIVECCEGFVINVYSGDPATSTVKTPGVSSGSSGSSGSIVSSGSGGSSGSYRSSGSRKSGGNSYGVYDVDEYYDEYDFYDEYGDDFDSFEDAAEYFYDEYD